MLKRPDTIKHQRFADQEVEDALAGAFEEILEEQYFFRALSNHKAALWVMDHYPDIVHQITEQSYEVMQAHRVNVKQEYRDMLEKAGEKLLEKLSPHFATSNNMTNVGMLRRALGRYVGHGEHVWDDHLDAFIKNAISKEQSDKYRFMDNEDPFYSTFFHNPTKPNTIFPVGTIWHGKNGEGRPILDIIRAPEERYARIFGNGTSGYTFPQEQTSMIKKQLKDHYKDLHGDAIHDLIEHVAKRVEQEVDTAQNYVQSMQSRFGKHGIDPRTGDVLSPGNKLFYGVTGVMLGGGMMFHGGEMVHLGLRGGKKGDGTETEPSIIRTVIGAGEIVGGAALAIKLLAGKIMGR